MIALHPRELTGARWSLSSLVGPAQVVLDLAYLDTMLRVNEAWLTPEYRAARPAAKYTPIFVQAGAHISSINRRLADIGLALQTSGAGDGHRIAGCIATGTHGAAIDVGAVHDTVLAIHLVVGPDKAYLLQPARAVARPELTAWLATQTGIPTEDRADDDLFGAALVSLGSLGIVHGVILEAVPLYKLAMEVAARPWPDAHLVAAIHVLVGQIRRRYPLGARPARFPGQVFGATTLPPGRGASIELAVSATHAEAAVSGILEVLRAHALGGRHLLGAVALRVVKGGTPALLGMNVPAMTCFIELPSIENAEVRGLYRACWDALDASGIPYTCHWGQMHNLSPTRLRSYYGSRVDRWRAARDTLLPSPAARAAFTHPMVAGVGL